MSVLSEFLTRIPMDHHALIRELDALVREAAPALVVSMKWHNPTYHADRNVCAIIDHPQHVNLQIWGGAALDDPGQLLSGTGKDMRHIRFLPGAPINRPAVTALVRQAAKAAGV